MTTEPLSAVYARYKAEKARGLADPTDALTLADASAIVPELVGIVTPLADGQCTCDDYTSGGAPCKCCRAKAILARARELGWAD